jgi:hypothetical protein
MTLVVAVGGLIIWLPQGFPWDRLVSWPLTGLVFFSLIFVMVGALRYRVRRAQELAA